MDTVIFNFMQQQVGQYRGFSPDSGKKDSPKPDSPKP